ncbi:AraC family transcriptional regulator [Eubacteriales bacterium OttesenSCG-928-N14]|nr:AraC family transcriptional regulator [Eubacteriales bacterium OttesenSCG-928-N14]
MEYETLVDEIQNYVTQNLHRQITVQEVATAFGYSPRHLDRIFVHYTGRTLSKHIRLMRLTDAAKQLAADGEHNVLDVALNHEFDSHEGFTKAFKSAFGISPKVYRKGNTPIQYFVPYPVRAQQIFERGMNEMDFTTRTVTAQVVERPQRTLIYLPSKEGNDYWAFCQEMGCEWEGLLNSIAAKYDTAAFITFGQQMQPKEFPGGAAAIEVPADYAGSIPNGYHTMQLPACKMLYFVGQPYADEEDFPAAITEVFNAYESYNPAQFGLAFDDSIAPSFNFGSYAESGARIAFAVKEL